MGVRHSEGAVGRFWRPEVLGSTVTPGAGGSKKRNRKVRNDVVTLGMGALPKQDVAKMLSKTLKVWAVLPFLHCSVYLAFFSSRFLVRLRLLRQPCSPRRQFTRSLSTYPTLLLLLFLAEPFALPFLVPQQIMAPSQTSVFVRTTTPSSPDPPQHFLDLRRLSRMLSKSKLPLHQAPQPITLHTLASASQSGATPTMTAQPLSAVPSKMPLAPVRSLTTRLPFIPPGNTASAPN